MSLAEFNPDSTRQHLEIFRLGRYVDDRTLAVAAGAEEFSTITPAAGVMWRVEKVHVWIPAIAGSTGNHRLELQIIDRLDSALVWTLGAWEIGAVNSFQVANGYLRGPAGVAWVEEGPAGHDAQMRFFSNLHCGLPSQWASLRFRYRNLSNLSQVATRRYRLTVRRIPAV